MILIFLIILMALCLYKIQFVKFNDDYMGIAQTTAIKGIFIGIVTLSHAKSYIRISEGGGGIVYQLFLDLLGQLMVTMFLFYSGYGVLESYKRKTSYMDGFLKNRVFKTLLHFDIAVAGYLILSFILKEIYPVENYILCWIGWEAIGNSNWFIFDILLLYILTWFAFLIAQYNKFSMKNKVYVICALVTFLAICMCIALRIAGKGEWWYNTILCYPLGMWFSCIKEKVDLWCKEMKKYYLTMVSCFILFLILYIEGNLLAYAICACIFSLLCTFLTMKIKVYNNILLWLGEHLFSIYILQRVPMIILTACGLNQNDFLFTAISIIITLILVRGFDEFLKKLDRKVFDK